MAYECTVEDLKALMKTRGEEAVEKLKKDFGTAEDLCKILKTDPNQGLNVDAVEQSRQTFGSNAIPSSPTKSFLRLVWEALHDTTLIILIIAAIISLGFSFYQGPDDEDTKTAGKVVQTFSKFLACSLSKGLVFA